MAATDTKCSFSTSLLSALVGLPLGLCISLIIIAFIEVVKRCTKRQRGPDVEIGTQLENNPPEAPYTSPTNLTDIPAITTFKTIPGHAFSEMDRDIKFQIAHSQELQDFEAILPRLQR
jgi:hypothetical protein